jgi:DNA-binding NarL/FixJ family response regulator
LGDASPLAVTMVQLRILIADDHDVVRHGVRSLLEQRTGWHVCGEAANGREAVQMARQLKPDVAVLDLTMPELSGLEATQQILKSLPRTEIIILSINESEEIVREVLDAGARGYVLKTDTSRELLAAVAAVSEHKPFFTTRVAEMVLGGYLENKGKSGPAFGAGNTLSMREREVLQLLVEGLSNKQVATKLGISAKTAEAHRINIMRKLNLHSIVELVRYAMRNKMIAP